MYIPSFCPFEDCPYHYQAPTDARWYLHNGYYTTQAVGKIKRFICRRCRRGFSEQTFSLDYYVKRPLPYHLIFDQVNNCAGIRKIAIFLNVSHQAILNRIGRLARQAMALQAELLESLQLCEDLVTDGFESFVTDQYQPNNIHLLVGARSQFLYSFDYAHLRRKGRMTEIQRCERSRREAQYLRPRISVSQSFSQIIASVEQLIGSQTQQSVTLHSDEKIEYKRVIANCRTLQYYKQQGCFFHTCTSSRKARTTSNPLFPVNYMDRQLRKDCANHVRETVRFSRNVHNCLERMAVYQLQHNYFKPYRISHQRKSSLRHAQVAGIQRERIEAELKNIFKLRRFFTHVKLNWSQLTLWARMVGNLEFFDGGYEPRYIWM